MNVAADGPRRDIIEEAERLTAAAAQDRTPLKLAGGVGIYFHCPSARETSLRRAYQDLDLVTASAHRVAVQHLLVRLGYEADARFNTLAGRRRLRFWDRRHQRQLDVFFDQMRMCHVIDLRNRLEFPGVCLTPADLFLTKMQIIEMNEKDLLDLVALLRDHPVADDESETINRGYIAHLAGRDWGLYRTLQLNTERVRAGAVRLGTPADVVAQRLADLWVGIETGPKSLAWRLRARIGDRLRWYEMPEEAGPGV